MYKDGHKITTHKYVTNIK